MASSSLFLLVLSFLFTAVQSRTMHDDLAERGLPVGIIPGLFVIGSFDANTGALSITLYKDSCVLDFSSEVSQLVYASPIEATLTLGKLEFKSLVVMKLGPTAQDYHPVKKIVSPFHPLEVIIEFWSGENDLAATVLTDPFSQEHLCIAQSVEKGITL